MNALNVIGVAILGWVLLMPITTDGAIYYVATTGNDANPGTQEFPLRTIQKCANVISGGESCIVKDGIYTESVIILKSGNSENPLIIKAQNNRGAVIYGRIDLKGDYIKLENFKVVMPPSSQNGINISGKYSQVIGCHISPEENLLGLNNTALVVRGENNIAKANFVEKTCFGIELSGYKNRIEDNEVTRLKLNGDCGDVDYMRFFGSNHVIRNNNFHGINMNEVGGAHVDCFQTFDNNGSQYSIQNVLVEGNFCSDASQGMMLSGIYYKQSRNLIVRNNVFTRNRSWCVCLVDIAEAHFFNNTCDTTGGIHGIWCRGGNNIASCEFKNNIVYGTGTLYGVMETAELIDGDSKAPGRNNLLYKPNQVINGYSGDIINKDPLFVDKTKDNYRLQANSPAKDAGAPITGWENAYDKDGLPRPIGRGWDIGAYEFANGALKAPTGLKVVPAND